MSATYGERWAQCAAEVCQMATLLVREEISHTDAANWILELAEKTCDTKHEPCAVHEKGDGG